MGNEKKKKLVILETCHAQYAMTQAAVFEDYAITYITTEDLKNQLCSFNPDAKEEGFVIISSLIEDEQRIIKEVQQLNVDLFLISPVFDSYQSLKNIVKNITCTKVVTIHNLNTWFKGRVWSPNSFKDRMNMRAIIKSCDFIAVEDFIYNYLTSTNHPYLKGNNFIYIPYTIFHEDRVRRYEKRDDRLKVVLPGHIIGDRRSYDNMVEVIRTFVGQEDRITFSFAGRAKDDYGKGIKRKLEEIRKECPEIVSYFEDDSTVEMFVEEMETGDVVISTSRETYSGMKTVEYIGKTKPTAAIHDMMTYELPGLLPSHLEIPKNLKGSAFSYSSKAELIDQLNSLLENPSILKGWKLRAKENSLNFTAEKIRKGLPF